MAKTRNRKINIIPHNLMKQYLLLFFAALFGCLNLAAETGDPTKVAGTYNCDLYLTLDTPIDDTTEPLPNIPVSLEAGSKAGTVNFAIYDLNLGGDMGSLGDIVVKDVSLLYDGTKYTFGENAPVSLKLTMGGGTINATASINSKTSYIEGDKLYADVDVMWTDANMPIYVRVISNKKTPAEQPAAKPGFQLANADFNGAWVQSRPWDSANGYFDWSTLTDEYWAEAAYKLSQFTQPEGWTVAHVTGLSGPGATVVGKCDTLDATKPDYAVTLTNNPNPFMASQIVPGFITLGTSWATINGLDWTTGTPKNADGGAFGGQAFKALPDAISLKYKRSHGEANATERASVIAYTWKGTFTQADVPAQTAMAKPVKVTMYGRDRAILGKETPQGGAVTKSADAQLVASAEYYIEGDQADWNTIEVPLTYADATGKTAPDSINVILSANDYFADRTLMGAGNSLTVDDVKLVYYHALSALSYDGTALDLTKGATSFDIAADAYDAAKLAYAVKGIGAKATTNYDAATKTLTIRVEGNDFADNAESFTTYTLSFGKSTGVEGVKVDTTTDADAPAYDLSGRRAAQSAKGVLIIGGQKVIR